MAGDKRVLMLGTGHIPIAKVTQGTPGLYRAEVNGSAQVQRMSLNARGNIAAIIFDARDPQRVFVGAARDGVWRSLDGGATWHPVHDGLLYKEVWSLVQHPSTGDLYCGTQPAEVFRSTDGGDTWSECEGLRNLLDTHDWSFPGPPFVAHVKHLSVTEADPQLVFGAVEEGWRIRSRDGGSTWRNLKIGTAFDSHTAHVMPDDPKVIVSTSGIGICRSEDGGDSFADANTGLQQRYMVHVAVHPDRPKVLFTAGAEVPPPFWQRPDGANAAFYRSSDQGRSWEPLHGGLPDHMHAAPRCIVADPVDPETVYVGMSDGKVLVTHDSGDTFSTLVDDGLPAVTSITVSA